MDGWMDEEGEGGRLCLYASIHCLVFEPCKRIVFRRLNFKNILMADSHFCTAETNKKGKAIILQFKNIFK